MTFDAKFQEVGELYADFGAFMRGEKGEKGDKGEKGEKGEDANTDLFANAVIGSAEGEVVRVDDVSPLEHHPLVKVKSRNLFNNVDDFKGFSHSYVGRTLTVTGQYTNKFILLEDGKKYTFSCQSTRTGESGGGIFLRAYTEDRVNYINVGSAINVLSPTLTTTLPIGYPYLRITFYGYYSTDDVDTGDATYTDIMLEEGANATGYIHFVEPASVTVTTCGKNLWNNGNVSINGSHQTLALNQILLKGITYTFSADVESTDTDATTCMIYTPDLSMSLGQIQRGLQKSISFTPSENIYRLTLYSSNTSGNGTSDTATFSNIQLEVGNVATDFEEHKGVQTLTPNADGTVEGITSLAPTMTLHTNNADVVIHCEYNRDTNKALESIELSGGATVTKDGTVVSQNADFGEVAEWGDGNPLGEDRTGYFVCADVPVHGIVMKKATSTDDVKGVTISAPAFAGNYSKDKVDSNGNLLPKYSYVAIIGFVPVIDKGRCSVGGRCMPDDNGCAIPSSNSMGYQVVNRIDENRVLIIIEPNGDMVQRIKTKVNDIQSNTANTIKGTATGTAISMRDVSPIEHTLDCSVASKNFFNPHNYDAESVGVTVYNGVISVSPVEVENDLIGGLAVYDLDLGESTKIGVDIEYDYEISGNFHDLHFLYDDKELNVTPAVVDGVASLKGTLRNVKKIHIKYEPHPASSGSIKIQIEKLKDNENPTPYTPYVENLSTVEVSRYGKNLLNDAKRTKPTYGNVYFGTETSNGSFTLPAGTYTFSVDIASGINPNVYVNKKDGTQIAVNYGKNYVSFTLTEQTDIVVKVYNSNITSAEQVYTAQIERGANKTAYEPYIEPTTYHFATDGTPTEVIKSISPNMTLISNNEGAVIDCAYNIDTKTYIDNKFAELQALILEG